MLEDASMRENQAFKELTEALAQRRRFDAILSVYSAHWEGYEHAVSTLASAVRAYETAALALLQADADRLGQPVG